MLFAQRKPNSVMKHLDRLNAKEKRQLMMAPVWFVLYAALKDGKIEDGEIREAVEIVHTRRFSAVDLLQDYYKNVDLFFEENLSYELQHLSGEIEVDINNIKAKIHELRPIIRKIDRRFGYALIDSFNSLAKFVVMSSKSPLDGLRFFVFPDILEKETGKAIE
ncbi:MAG TPA: hypothetical protein DDX92_03045 [Flavobacteriales bacterium]|jgi:hypothetical protein|nr:hypothetical protein [Flavobacteriales bacterium]